MKAALAGLIAGRRRADHGITVWRRDIAGTAWAWSCTCGQRYTADLPDHDTAAAEGGAHHSAATRGTVGEAA